MALRGGEKPGFGDDGDDVDWTAGWAESTHDGARCYTQGAQSGAGVGVTFCMRGFFRRAVVVMGFGLAAPDPATVARGTGEAWRAQ